MLLKAPRSIEGCATHCLKTYGRRRPLPRQRSMLEVSLKQSTLATIPVLRNARSLNGASIGPACSNGYVWTAGQWLENSAEVSVDVPLEEVWEMWRDREAIPRWMPWIAEVKSDPQDPTQSTWVLSTEQFGQKWTFSWLAQDLTPVLHQKIHWRSVEGSQSSTFGGLLEVPNRGSVRFYRTGPSSCNVKLTVSYEVPTPLLVFLGALSPVVDNILKTDMQRFQTYAQQHSKTASK